MSVSAVSSAPSQFVAATPSARAQATDRTQVNTDFAALATALQAGDVTGAQQALATLQQRLQQMGGAHHRHHHRHAGAAGAAGSTTPASPGLGVATAAIGSQINVQV